MSCDFTFDEALHEYRIHGRVVPSVTKIIRSSVTGWQASEWYLDRGRAVHAAVKLALDDRLDWKSLDSRIEGRVRAVLNFIEASQLKHIATEYRMSSVGYQFAGTADFIGTDPENRVVLIDYKSSVEPSVEVQLGLYAKLWDDADTRQIHRACALETRSDATYKAHWFTHRQIRNAGNIGLAMLTVHHWKERSGLNKTNEHHD